MEGLTLTDLRRLVEAAMERNFRIFNELKADGIPEHMYFHQRFQAYQLVLRALEGEPLPLCLDAGVAFEQSKTSENEPG